MEPLSYFGVDLVIYVALAIFFVKAVRKNTSRRVYAWLAVAFFTLLPTWDVVLSSILFYSSCPFVPKTVIYETAETDGIYYEGDYRDGVILTHSRKLEANPKVYIPSIYDDLAKGYQYFESLVSTVQAEIPGKQIAVSPPTVYRCRPQNQDPNASDYTIILCNPVENIQSNYLVRLDVHRFLLVKIRCLNIYNRASGVIMAEYRDVIFDRYRGWAWGPIPFFDWLNFDWNMAKHGGAHCPENLRYSNIQYDVLKVKK
jgi:hypothetical protein